MRWYLARKVDWYPFDTFLISEGYLGRSPGKSPWRFNSLLFYYKDGYETSLRGKKDIDALKRYLRRSLTQEFVEKVGKEIRQSAKALHGITRTAFASRKALKEHLPSFCSAYARMFAVFQLPHQAQTLTPELDQKLLLQFGHSRDEAARLFTKIERIYRNQLGNLLNLPRLQALMLFPDEVQAFLDRGFLPKGLKNRKTCAILTLKGKTSIYWNRQADALFHREYLHHQKTLPKSVSGQVAYKGRVRGRAYVAFAEKDFKGIPQKAILICSMTRYTIVPYLKRVSAIVTDQGGITCHAAIIARELKIPTIVGTAQATEVFKSGDILEVDAIKGKVTLLKKS
ncbi:hypothetical protein J4419_00055 [Candidatus Woesearchaeota archaeon]|nr:hypothetical protein [Candidatus Woesearchaeota archaeon]